ncbi:hypothetical protein NL108_017520 [Boleophthalmus pectinirostris]|nr:hypothetical protein NL108_017520 [Boleophthalmus pectinirostris]
MNCTMTGSLKFVMHVLVQLMLTSQIRKTFGKMRLQLPMPSFFSSPCHCSVPLCSANQQLLTHLSFHNFHTDTQLRMHWVHAIRRDEAPNSRRFQTAHTYAVFILPLITFTSVGFIYTGSFHHVFPKVFLVCDVSVNRAY